LEAKNEKVNTLNKVFLMLESGTGPEQMDLTSKPVECSFILGAGSEGLTPFEYEIVNKTVGEEILIPLARTEMGIKFEHLAQFIADNVNVRDAFYLKATIVDVADADNREIVKAMAESVKHGHDCDCECGCGG
jgi:hypothetical protein